MKHINYFVVDVVREDIHYRSSTSFLFSHDNLNLTLSSISLTIPLFSLLSSLLDLFYIPIINYCYYFLLMF